MSALAKRLAKWFIVAVVCRIVFTIPLVLLAIAKIVVFVEENTVMIAYAIATLLCVACEIGVLFFVLDQIVPSDARMVVIGISGGMNVTFFAWRFYLLIRSAHTPYDGGQ